MGEPDRIEFCRLGRHRAFVGDRWIGAGKKGATRRRREHLRRPRNRGSYNPGTALLDAALPGKLRQPGEALANQQHPDVLEPWIDHVGVRPADVAATGWNVTLPAACRPSTASIPGKPNRVSPMN